LAGAGGSHLTQRLVDLVGSQVRAFAFFGGVAAHRPGVRIKPFSPGFIDADALFLASAQQGKRHSRCVRRSCGFTPAHGAAKGMGFHDHRAGSISIACWVLVLVFGRLIGFSLLTESCGEEATARAAP
jgi:hypothetical protein